MNKPKRRHHHVWQHYLKPWAHGGAILCLQNGKVFSTGTTRVAVEKDFYKFHGLTAADERMVTLLFSKSHASAQKSFASLLNRLMAPFREVMARPGASSNPAVSKLLDKYASEVLEELHADVEARFIPLLKLSLEGDISFYEDDRCRPFFDYITKQYMRTKGIKERFIATHVPVAGADLRPAWNMLSFMFAQNIGASLYVERRQRKLVLLCNFTDTPFITGDQPVVNLHAMGRETTRLTLFYPLSPKRALWLGEVDEPCPFNDDNLTQEDIVQLNSKIASASYQQVFGNNREILEALREFTVPSPIE